MSSKPNVLFLFSDQHNAKCMSNSDHKNVKTPNLDRLVDEGIKFTNAYCNNPICTPSRISFLSSLYPSTHGYYGLYGHEPFFPMTSIFKYFKENGYRTGALGKLHTPRYWIERDCQFLYDEFIEYPKYLEAVGLYELNDNRAFTGHKDGHISSIPFEHSCESVLAKQAIRFIRNEGEPKDRGDNQQPWFAWVSFSRPHQPYTPSEPYASLYPADALNMPPINKNTKQELRDSMKKIRTKDIKEYVSSYLALVSQVDAGIGIILNELQKSFQLDNTIIIYSSDHGDYAGEHGLVEKRGGISSRAVTNIPMIIRLPNKKYQRKVIDEIVESVDIFPTLCDMVNLTIPNTVQGISMKRLIQGIDSNIKHSALTENAYRKALATKEWRYVSNINGEKDELYYLKEDPWELNNLIDNKHYQHKVYEMQKQLITRISQARKPINVINGKWHNHKYDLDGRLDLNTCGEMNPYW